MRCGPPGSGGAGLVRATYEAWGLSVLVLVYSRAWQARYLLAGAGATTLGIALMYIVRVEGASWRSS